MSAVDFIGPNSINYQAYQLPVMATAGQKISGTLVEAVRMNLVTNEGFVHKVGHPFRCPPPQGLFWLRPKGSGRLFVFTMSNALMGPEGNVLACMSTKRLATMWSLHILNTPLLWP